MSLVAIWRNDERARSSIWVASDSRISHDGTPLIDEGGKIFSLPVLCRRPGDEGFFDVPYFAQTVGLACVGGSLVYQHVHACLIPILSNLAGFEAAPAMEDIAATAANVTSKYAQSLGRNRPEAALKVTLAVVGACPLHARQEAYRIEPVIIEGLFQGFAPSPINLDGGVVEFLGDRADEAGEALVAARASADHPIAWHRAPARVVRRFIDDPAYPSIGGDVQLGIVGDIGFTRLMTVVPRVVGEPAASMRINNIDIGDLGPVGPCQIAMTGMAGI